MHAPLSGPAYLHEGLRLVLSPGLRRFVILPLAINCILFVALISLAVQQFSGWVELFMPNLPAWARFLEYLLWPLFVLLVLVLIFFTFVTVATLICAPFNGFLSEKVEGVVRGHEQNPPFRWGELIAMVPRTLERELRKLAYFLPRAALLLLLSFTPVLNIIAVPLWILFSAWMMAVQYIDYPADNHKLSWNDMLTWLRTKRIKSLSFGGVVYLGMMLPLFNLLLMPAAVAGATVFWVREQKNISALTTH